MLSLIIFIEDFLVILIFLNKIVFECGFIKLDIVFSSVDFFVLFVLINVIIFFFLILSEIENNV